MKLFGIRIYFSLSQREGMSVEGDLQDVLCLFCLFCLLLFFFGGGGGGKVGNTCMQ